MIRRLVRRRARDERGTAAIELVLIAPVLMVICCSSWAWAGWRTPGSRSRASPPTPLERPRSSATPASPPPPPRPPPSISRRGRGQLHRPQRRRGPRQATSPAARSASPCPAQTKLSDVGLAGFPGSRMFTATSTVPIETYRVASSTIAGSRVMRQPSRTRRRDERGASTMFVVLFAVALLAVAGLVIDGGYALGAKREAMNSAEQAARVGADALDQGSLRDGADQGRPRPGGRRRAGLPALRSTPTGRWSVNGGEVTVTVTGQPGHQDPLRGRGRLASRSRRPRPRSRSTRTTEPTACARRRCHTLQPEGTCPRRRRHVR